MGSPNIRHNLSYLLSIQKRNNKMRCVLILLPHAKQLEIVRISLDHSTLYWPFQLFRFDDHKNYLSFTAMPGLYIKDDRCLDHLSDLQLGEFQFYATLRLLVVDLCNFPVQQGGECSGAGQNCKPNI